MIGKKLLIAFLLPPRNATQWNKRNKTFILTRSTNHFITLGFNLNSLFCGGYMSCLDLVVPAFPSITFDCCKLLFQAQVSSKAMEIQLQHAVHGYTALECGKNVNVCLCLVLFVRNLKWELILLCPELEQERGLTVFSVWFILALNVPLVCVPSLSLRASSNTDFITGGLYCKPCGWVLLNCTGHMSWTHAQLHFPCVHPCTLRALDAVPFSFGASF